MKSLEIKWTISKGRHTYGYNICTLWDKGTRYSCNGGGYDMVGTVFAYWLWDNFKDKIIETCKPRINEFYGFIDGQAYSQPGKYWIDGGCGFSSMEKIANAIGLEVQKVYDHNGRELKFIMIYEDKDYKEGEQ